MRRIILFCIFFALLLVGCSSGDSPTSPQENGISNTIDNLPIIGASLFEDGSFNALGMLGAYELTINPENSSAELTAKRTSAIGESYVVSGIGFFTISPCSNCLKLNSIELNPDGNVVLTFSISHPFEKGDAFKPPSAINRLDLDVFDLALIIAPQEATATNYNLTGVSAYNNTCVEADGYTTELAEMLEDSAAMPYFLVIDDSIGGTGSYNKFEMGTKDIEFDTVFDLSSGVLRFDLYLTMGYGFSAVKAGRLNPAYYNPEFNRKSAWKVDVTPPEGENPPAVGNTWSNTDNTTAYNVTVEVYDWQIGANVDVALTNTTDIYAASDVATVSVEIPGMNSTLQSVTTADSGLGTPDDPLVYTLSITNENLLVEGEYTGLVKVTDERAVGAIGDRDFLIDSPDGVNLVNYNLTEFATYQTFTATVVIGSTIELTAPNGGEEWSSGTDNNITWSTTLYSGMIKLEYSKDGFVADINEIIASTDDDGVYEWTIPDDPSTTVRVRASLADAPTVYDDSDADFSIVESGWITPVLLDGNSNMPRSVQNEDGDIVTIWHKDTLGIQYSYNDSSGWTSPVQARSTVPSFMHLVNGKSGKLVYVGYKGAGCGSGVRFALRWTGSAGAWDCKQLNGGTTEQPNLFFPDDDGSLNHIYIWSNAMQMIDYDTWDSGWSFRMAGGLDSSDIRMSSCHFMERNTANHFIAYHRISGGFEDARIMRGLKDYLWGWPKYTIYHGASGEEVDSVALSLDSSGTLHSAFRVFDGTNYTVNYSYSTNNGSSWSTPETLVDTTSEILEDYIGVDTDSSNNVYITYTEDNAIYLICSNATGWDAPVTFIDVPGIPSGYHYTQPFPLVTADDILHVFYVYKNTAVIYGNLFEVTYE
jgi:hypothetical protein